MKKDKFKFDFTTFGLAIKAARKAKGYSRNALADELNIAPRYIGQIGKYQLFPVYVAHSSIPLPLRGNACLSICFFICDSMNFMDF